MKKIALLRGNPKSSGLGRILQFLVKDYHVDCYIWDRQGDYKPIIEGPNVEYIKCGVRDDFYSLTTLIKLVFFQVWLGYKLIFAKVDCVHAFDLPTGVIGMVFARLKRVKFVYHCLDPYHATLPENWPAILARFAYWLENVVISDADIFIITDRLRMAQHKGSKPKKIVEFANVPMLDIPPKPYRSRAEFCTGFIGSMTTGRNLKTLIQSIRDLESDGFKCILGGYGPLEEEIEDFAKGISNIEYTKWIPYSKVLEIEAEFDAFMVLLDENHKGYKWGSSNKLYESMYFKRPIIVCEGTLAGRQVEEMGNGIVIQYDNKDALKEALLFLKDNPDIAEEMGEKGRAEFDKSWSPQIMERRLLAAYSDLFEHS